ncbi:MAG: glycosyltransferase family 39 protein [Planctomycetaceae bacterium]|nr:glycosyltransferase family 39 protein [Planctomycetaceae bacterium]
MQTSQTSQNVSLAADFSYKTAVFLFWSVVIFFAALWVILPSLFYSAYRISDVIELQCIAREWVLSTRKHPMLPAWILELVNILTNRTYAAPYIAAQICMIITLWSVWQLGRQVLSEKLALIGSFAILPYYFLTYHSLVYNQNTTLIAFWSLSVYLVFRALQTNRIWYWFISGVSIGLAFYAKYPAAFLVLSLLIFMFTQQEGRQRWREIGPYLTMITALLIFLPHIIWLYQYDFATITYAQSRHTYTNQIFRILSPTIFIIFQLEHWITIFVVLFPSLGFLWRWRFRSIENDKERFCERYLFYCFMIPCAICVCIGAIKNYWLSPSYGAPFWTFLGVWLLLRFRVKMHPNIFVMTLKYVALLEVVMCMILVVSALSPHVTGKQKKQFLPMRELGAECDRIWYSQFDVPCPYVTGDWFIAGFASYAMKDRPRVHFYWNIHDGDIHNPNSLPTGTWSTDSDVNNHGGIVVWQITNTDENYAPKYLHTRFPKANIIPNPIILPYKTSAKVPPLKVGVAVIPP